MPDDKWFERRVNWYAAVVALALGTLGYTLWHIQVANAAYFRTLAKSDYLRQLPIPAPRGQIVTSDGVPLATSVPSWTAYYLDTGQTLAGAEVRQLAAILHETPGKLRHRIESTLKAQPSYYPVRLVKTLTLPEMSALLENQKELPGIRVQPVPERWYPHGSLGAQWLGYASLITASEYQTLMKQGYSPNAIVGQTGLEYQYERYLQGQGGGEYAVVNSQGQLVKLYGTAVPKPGDTLHLTINYQLQATAQHALQYVMHAMQTTSNPSARSAGAQSGAVVALDVHNGDVLAMASLPSYDPNTLHQDWSQIAANPYLPLENRVTQGLYSPGSIFKPIMAVAALGSHVLTPSTTIFDPGYFPKDPQFHNWYAPGFGTINIEQAIELSDDTFFYYVGYWLGIDRMSSWMRKFLLGSPTGIDLPGEVSGIIPTPARLQADGDGVWTWGWNLNTAIGQGIDQFTLIGLARAEAAIANGGTLWWPHMVASITTPEGKIVKRIRPRVQGRIVVPQVVWNTVHTGMEMSAQDPQGTGNEALKNFPLPLASKTGTAQRVGQTNNAFFVTYGPMPHPRIVIVVYVREGNWGADSGFVARAIYDQYFHVKDPGARAALDQVYGPQYAWPFGWTAPKTTP
jgi:penicillin-binding protein 2